MTFKPRITLPITPPIILLALAIVAYAGYFSYVTIVRYFAFEARALDMGNLDQAIWNTAHGNWFRLTNQPGTVNRLSLHVELLLIPISWLYWVYSGPPTLLILQAIVVALGAWPIYTLAQRTLDNSWLALVLAFAFLLNPTIQAANWLEFHPVTLAPTFLMAAFYCLVVGRSGGFAAFAVLASACKEEIALLVFMLGLYALFILRLRRLGMVTMLLSLAWALVAVLVIQNTFAAGNVHWGRYAYLGETPLQMLTTVLTRPDLLWVQLQDAGVLRYLGQLLLPVGFTALLAPEILLLALPSLGINLLADFPPMHQVYELIYAAPIVPFVLIGAVWGVKRILAGALWARFWILDFRRLPKRHSVYLLAGLLVGGCALYAQYRHGYLPGGGNYRLYTITEHHRRAAPIMAQIPSDARVSAQDRLNPHVSGRETVYIFPRIENADTVFLDVTGPAWPQHPTDVRKTVDTLLAEGFGVAAAEDGYLLLRRGIVTRRLPEAFFDAWRTPEAPADSPPPAGASGTRFYRIDFADVLRLLDVQVTTDSHGELVTQLYWEILKPIGRDLRFYVGYGDGEGAILQDTLFYPPVAELWYPTSQWRTGETVRIQTLPWTLDAKRFVLLLGVFEGKDGWHEGRRLPITQGAQSASTQGAGNPLGGAIITPRMSLPVFEQNTLVRLGGYQRGEASDWVLIPSAEALPAKPLDVHFAEEIVLDGVTLSKTMFAAGETISFQLHWHAGQPPVFDYNVFIHVLDAAGNKVAQADGQPHDTVGLLPVTTWHVDQPVIDLQHVILPSELAPGVYRLVAGLYNWQNGERLPIIGGNAEAADGVTIAQIEIQ